MKQRDAVQRLDHHLAQVVIRKYARMIDEDRYARCTPGFDEWRAAHDRRGKTNEPHSASKAIYDSREAAEAAAAELTAIDGWPLYAYPCERSKHGHYHLTRKQRKH